MANITLHRINACKFDYEFLGKSIQELSEIYGFRPQDIEDEIDQKGWERKLEPTVLPQTSDIQAFATALESITRSKLGIISLFRQIDHQPLIAELEKTFLDKALELASALNIEDDRAATKLMSLVKAVEALQSRNPIDLADQVSDKLKHSGVVVQIANHIN